MTEAELRCRIYAQPPTRLAAVLMDAANFQPAAARRAIAARGPVARSAASRGIAIVPVLGNLMQHPSLFNSWLGGTSTDTISAAISDALADETISQILLDIDSEGGEVFGIIELAAEIRAARAQKPVVAIADSSAVSGAYWLGCSASEFFVAPGGQVGGIGIVTAHEDHSRALEQAGIAVTLVAAGQHKIDANPFQPLAPEAKRHLQTQVDAYFATFTRDVAKGRRTTVDAVRNGMGQGRVLGADRALAAGMVDGITSRAEVLKRMQRAAQVTGPAKAGAFRPTMSIEARRRETFLAQAEAEVVAWAGARAAVRKASATSLTAAERRDLRRVAVHESAHLTLATKCGSHETVIGIEARRLPDGSRAFSGHCTYRALNPEDERLTCLAGAAAAVLDAGYSESGYAGPQGDALMNLIVAAMSASDLERARPFYRNDINRCVALVHEHWREIDSCALLEAERWAAVHVR